MDLKTFRRFLLLGVVINLLQLLLPLKSDAYIDPNTGGFFFSTVLPFVYGILGAIVIFWKRISNVLKSIFTRKKEKSDL